MRAARVGVLALLVAAIGTVGASRAADAHGTGSVTREAWGSTGEGTVDRYTLTNGAGMRVRIITYGGIVQSIEVPDRHGHNADVALGFDNLADYVAHPGP